MNEDVNTGARKLKVDLGCGNMKKDGYIGIDKFPFQGVDTVLNLDNPNLRLPFGDNIVDEMYASHFLEHIHNFIPLMNECFRVLKSTGKFEIIVPLAPSRGAFDDPTHVRFFTEGTFDYFTKDSPQTYDNPEIKGKWAIVKNDYSPMYIETPVKVEQDKMRELHVILTPVKI